MICLITEEPLWGACIVYLDRPCRNLGRVGGNGHEPRVSTGEIQDGVQLASARLCERRLRYAMVLAHELELDHISHLSRDLIRVEDGI